MMVFSFLLQWELSLPEEDLPREPAQRCRRQRGLGAPPHCPQPPEAQAREHQGNQGSAYLLTYSVCQVGG
jgi:hypothetical protein